MSGDAQDDGRRERPHSLWHWLTAATGLVVVLCAFGYLLYDAAARREVPYPMVTLALDTVVATRGGHVVRVRARNDGGATAASLVVRAELHDAQGTVEEAEATIDYLPPSSVREAGFVFARDPRGLRLDLRAVSFDIP